MDEQVQSERADGLKSVVSGLTAEGKILPLGNNNRRRAFDKRIIDRDGIQPWSMRDLLYSSEISFLPGCSRSTRPCADIFPAGVEKRGFRAARSEVSVAIFETMSKYWSRGHVI